MGCRSSRHTLIYCLIKLKKVFCHICCHCHIFKGRIYDDGRNFLLVKKKKKTNLKNCFSVHGRSEIPPDSFRWVLNLPCPLFVERIAPFSQKWRKKKLSLRYLFIHLLFKDFFKEFYNVTYWLFVINSQKLWIQYGTPNLTHCWLWPFRILGFNSKW